MAPRSAGHVPPPWLFSSYRRRSRPDQWQCRHPAAPARTRHAVPRLGQRGRPVRVDGDAGAPHRSWIVTLIDNRGRLFGRLNLVDAAIVVFALVLIPLGYGTFLLFRSAAPAVSSVTRV